MQEEFDKQLRDKIAGAFAGIEFSYEPAHWDALQQKMRQRKRKAVALWLGRAATLLLPLMLGWMVWDDTFTFSNITQEVPVSTGEEKIPAVTDTSKSKMPINKDEGITDRSEALADGKVQQQELPGNLGQDTGTVSLLNKQAIKRQAIADANQSDTDTTQAAKRNAVTNLRKQNTTKPGYSIRQVLAEDFAPGNANPLVEEQNKPDSTLKSKGREALAESASLLKEGVSLPEEPDRVPEKDATNSLRLGVALNSQVNYLAEGSSSASVQPGGGLYAELPIGNRFSLQTGAFVARQRVQSPSSFGNNEMATVVGALLDGQVMNQQAVARLTSIDIPINLRYTLWKNNTSGFISAGFSSLAYLNEEYTSRIQQTVRISSIEQAEALGIDIPQTEIVTASAFQSFNANVDKLATENAEPLSRYDLFSMLNVSFAVAYPLNNRLNLLVEPYIQYPLGALGSEDIRLGAGGLSLRMQFNNDR